MRKALGENENDTLFIETLPKRGYRFVPLVKDKDREPEQRRFQRDADYQRLTTRSGFLPSVSRDGRVVAYVSAQGGTFHIWRMDANGMTRNN